MSRRSDMKVPKYAFIQFNCDEKTIQLKTKDLVWEDTLKVNCSVQATWEFRLLQALVLGLSDDPTVLNEIERTYMKTTLAGPPKKNATIAKRPKAITTQRKSAIPVRKTSNFSNRTKPLKRKAPKGIEFVTHKKFRPSFTNEPQQQPKKSYDMSRLTPDEVNSVMTENNAAFPTTVTDTQPTNHFSSDTMETMRQMNDNIMGILEYVKRLEEKIDQLSPTPQPTTCTREMATQTDPPVTTTVKDITAPEDPSFQIDTGHDSPFADNNFTVPTVVDTTPPFTDNRLLDIRPVDFEGKQLDRDMLELMVEQTASMETTNVQLEPEDIVILVKKSQSAGHFAKNILFRCFTIRELYGRNATGKNFIVPGSRRC